MTAQPSTFRGPQLAPAHLGQADPPLPLARQTAAQLDAAHRTAPRPASLQLVKGPLDGDYLVLAGSSKPLLHRFLRFGATFSGFRWSGKSFTPHSDIQGVGYNRFSALGRRSRFEGIKFDLSIALSEVDGEPVVRIAYPPMLSGAYQIVDELRETSPGVFLGRGMLLRPGRPAIALLWFSLRRPQHVATTSASIH